MILEKVETLCRERGITVAKLEKECELGNATVRGWKESSPRLDNLKKVADYFQIPISYFLD